MCEHAFCKKENLKIQNIQKMENMVRRAAIRITKRIEVIRLYRKLLKTSLAWHSPEEASYIRNETRFVEDGSFRIHTSLSLISVRFC